MKPNSVTAARKPTAPWRKCRGMWLSVVLMMALGLAACGDITDGSGPGGGGAADSAAAELLPADIQSSGKLTIASFVPYAPFAMVASDGKTLEGIEPDLARAMAEQLGLTLDLVVVKNWDTILPGVSAGRYDAAMASFLDTEEKHAAYAMVDYFRLKVQLVAAADSGIETVTDLCGKTAALQKGSAFQIDVVNSLNEECVDGGLPDIEMQQLQDQNESIVQMQSGRVDFEVTNVATAAVQVAQLPDKLELVLDPIEAGGDDLVGIAIPKGNLDLAKALQAALKSVVADGTYDEIMERYDVDGGAYTEATINGAR